MYHDYAFIPSGLYEIYFKFKQRVKVPNYNLLQR